MDRGWQCRQLQTAAAQFASGLSARSWPLRRVVTRGEPLVIDQVAALFPGVPARPGGRPPSSALLLPLRDGGGDRVTGVLVLGVSPLLPLDTGYRDFLLLVAAQIEAALAAAQSRQRRLRPAASSPAGRIPASPAPPPARRLCYKPRWEGKHAGK